MPGLDTMRLLVQGSLSVWLGACASAPPIEAPRAAIHAEWLPGPAYDTAADGAIAVQVDLFAVRLPQGGEPLDQQVALVAASGGQPFRGAVPLAGATVLPTEGLEAWPRADEAAGSDDRSACASGEVVVLPGAATVVRIEPALVPAVQLGLGERGLVVTLLTRDAEGFLLRTALAPGPTTLGPRGWFFPSAQVPGAAGCLLLLRPAGEATAGQLAAARASLGQEPPPAPTLLASQLAVVENSIGAQNRRGALIALAARCGTPIVIDVVLSADERTLIDLSRAAADTPADAPDFAWEFSRRLGLALVRRQERGDVPPELLACLRRHFGALDDDPVGLESILHASADSASFWRAVQSENVLALADRSAARRLRATDWLVARGAAIDGYDPLAPAEARKRALRQAQVRAAESGR